MRRVLISLLFIFSLTFSVNAQQYRDVLHLKDGSVVRGYVKENIPDKWYKVELSDGTIAVYTPEEVNVVTKEIVPPAKFNNPSGYFCLVELQIPTLLFDAGSLGVDVINGYRYSQYFAAGLGVGIETYLFSNFQVPVYAHLRSDFLSGNISPYIAVNVGYNLSTYKPMGGFLFKPQIGLSFNLGKYRMNCGMDFRYQSTKYTDDNWQYHEYWGLGLFGLNIGIEF